MKQLCVPSLHARLGAVALVLGWLGAVAAHGDDLALWSFEALVAPPAGPTTPPIAADGGVAGGSCQGVHADPLTAWTVPVGNGSPRSLSANRWSAGDAFVFQTSSLGYTDVAIGWEQTRSSTGPAQFSLEWSLDGFSWAPLAPGYTVLSSPPWSSLSYQPEFRVGPYSAPPEADNQPTIYFRMMALVSGSSTAGTCRIDNIFIAGEPAPRACCFADGSCDFLPPSLCIDAHGRPDPAAICGEGTCPPGEADQFCSTAELVVELSAFPGEIPVSLSSQDLPDAIVLRRPGPYNSGEVIPLELVALSLAGNTPAGPILLRESPLLSSRGLVRNVVAGPTGGFELGDAIFDVFVEIDLPGLGLLGLHTGGIPTPMRSPGITELPPWGTSFQSGPIDLPLIDPASGDEVGRLRSATHTLCPRPRCIYRVTCVAGPDCPTIPVQVGDLVAGSDCTGPTTGTCASFPTARRWGTTDCCVELSLIGCDYADPAIPVMPIGDPCECAIVPQGACCLPGGCMEGVSAAVCGAGGGFYYGDGAVCPSCDDSDPCTRDSCDPATGACVHTPVDCDDGDPCTIDSCDPATGDCLHTPVVCDDGDPCTVDSCDAAGNCRHDPICGACCLPDGSCTFVPQALCTGAFQGVGVLCNPCPPALGACCVNELCRQATPADCAAAGGVFIGPGAPCAPNPCRCDAHTGDSSCDGSVNFDDIDCFVAALIGEAAWNACGHGPDCDYVCRNDIDENGLVNFDDIDPFVLCLIMSGCL